MKNISAQMNQIQGDRCLERPVWKRFLSLWKGEEENRPVILRLQADTQS